MKHWSLAIGFLTMGAVLCPPVFSQQPAAPAPVAQPPAAKTSVEEVLLDIIVRDKKGTSITDLSAERRLSARWGRLRSSTRCGSFAW